MSLISYALLLSLIAMVGFGAVMTLGNQTSDSFDGVPSAMGSDGGGSSTTSTTSPMTPDERWQAAQDDWRNAIDQANSDYASAVAAAKATHDAAIQQNKSLPKQDRKAANQQANQEFNSAKNAAKQQRDSAKSAANAAKQAAKQEYQQSRKNP